MSDFNLVDPKGWEYDLQSVSHFAFRANHNGFDFR